jgi:hypothetical protein
MDNCVKITQQAYTILDEAIYKIGEEYEVENLKVVLHPLFIINLYENYKYAIIEILGDYKRIQCTHFIPNKIKILKYVTLEELHDTIYDGEFKCFNGDIYTCLNKELHSFNDKPSIQLTNGHNVWHKNGKIHRDNSMHAMEFMNGKKYWCNNGLILSNDEIDAAIKSQQKYKDTEIVERNFWKEKSDQDIDQNWLEML